jgi:hypothetical protein
VDDGGHRADSDGHIDGYSGGDGGVMVIVIVMLILTFMMVTMVMGKHLGCEPGQ